MDQNSYGNSQYGNHSTSKSSSQLASKMMMMDEDMGGGGGDGGIKRDASSMQGQSASMANSQIPSNNEKK